MSLLFWVFSLIGFLPVQDTVSLAEVAVYAPALDRFAQGQKVQVMEKDILAIYSGRTMADLLQEQSPVFVRQYGPGMLASPSFRGTTAGHTAVFWNGLPINSPSLGQSDLSLLPVVAFDKASLHFGSAGALFGNEAIGGSLHLESESKFAQGFNGIISQQVGSFGLWNTRVQGGYSSDKISLQTRFYRDYSENDFEYQDLSRPGTPETQEDHAQVEQWGILQDFAWNFAEKSQLKASLWWNQNDREIQPVMGSNTIDTQQDKSLRAVIDYFHFGKKSLFNLKTGFVQDVQLFNESLNETRQFIFGGEWDYTGSDRWTSRTGIRLTQSEGLLSTYEAQEYRLEGYHSSRFSPTEKISLAVNLRQLVYDGIFAPFTPSLGIDFTLGKSEKSLLLLKSSIGRGFKIPTLNDRFWNPGGNPDLLPERSWNGEIGLNFSRKGKVQIEQSLTYYRMNVDDWIIWLPNGSIWSPQNIREVKNQGLEYQGSGSWKTGKITWDLALAYTYSQALDLSSDLDQPRQLPYTPKHQGNASLKLSQGNLWVNLSSNYVGSRKIGTGNSREMEPFQLLNAQVGYDGIRWGKVRFPLSLQVLNALNHQYQVLYLRAMPGRSYQLNLTIHL